MVVKWKIAIAQDYVFAEFELEGGVIAPDQLPACLESFPLKPAELAGKGVILSGRGPIWLYSALVHLLHPVAWVGVFDPRLGGGVVVISHVPGLRVGDVVKVDYPSLIFSSSSRSYSLRVAVLGDPNSGKSVFLRLIYDFLAGAGVPVVAQEGDLTAPTQGWSLSPLGAEIRKQIKSNMDPRKRLNWVLESLRGLMSFPGIVLVDVGGGRPDIGVRVTEENKAILSLCTHFIVCSRDDRGQIDAWLREVGEKAPHLKLITICESRLHGEAVEAGGRFILAGLDRTLYANRQIPPDTLFLISKIAEKILGEWR